MPADRNVRILSICDRDHLRSARERALKGAGYDVESVSSDEFLRYWQVRSSAIAIICKTVNSESAVRLENLLPRYNPDIRILHLAHPPEFDRRSDERDQIPWRPRRLLRAVESMVDRT